MTQQRDNSSELREMFFKSELYKAERSTRTGATAVLARVTLAVIYLNLIVVSYVMLGAIGPVTMSVLFVAALFSPWLYQTAMGLLEKRRTKEVDAVASQQVRQEI